MYTELYTAALSGMAARQNQMDIISNNLANVSTAGFKIDELVFSERTVASPTSGGMLPSHVDSSLCYTDFSQGALKRTGNPLDAALDCEGFFVLEGEGGPRLTRDGRFSLGEGGKLTLNGMAVQGTGGDITLKDGPFTIGTDGAIFQDGAEVARIRVVSVADPGALTKEGVGLFLPPEGAALGDVESPKVVQGQIETSNASAIRLMVQMMDAVRAFEMHQRMIRTVDALTEKAVSLLGRTT